MAFREVEVVEIKEILRRWQRGDGLRSIAAAVGADRKTVRRYLEVAVRHGLVREPTQDLDDLLIGAVVAELLPGAPEEVGLMRTQCRLHAQLIERWVREGCKAPKVARLLQRQTGVVVPERTLRRFIAEELGDAQRAGASVRVVDPPPGQILEVDFMELGRVNFDDEERKLQALVCVASYSRHLFVWPCLRVTTSDLIEGLEAAWAFFGGVFPVVVTDNPKTIVAKSDPLSPSLNLDVAEYAQARKFVLDLARVRHPRDKPRVERAVSYIRNDGFIGERFLTLEDVRRHLERWCREIAGTRLHGTTRRKPAEVFAASEQTLLLPMPTAPYDVPSWVTLTVGNDHAISVLNALYSVPYALRGEALRVRVDCSTVKMYQNGLLVKVHPRVASGMSQIDPADLPPGTGELATRDAEGLQERAARCGEAIGEYARRLLEGPLPWTQMRHVYRLLGLCKTYGNARVDTACRLALSLEVVEVIRIQRMLEQGLDGGPPPPQPPKSGGQVLRPRFGRDPSEFKPLPRGGTS